MIKSKIIKIINKLILSSMADSDSRLDIDITIGCKIRYDAKF